ncbi:MAG: efflux RND transporter periplasmic adaptor subunit [Comamonadaceae bacterium]|nr:MAG: efflux RND transporter periplasmic adaptor subunit [Comamonadaceae bacterium]
MSEPRHSGLVLHPGAADGPDATADAMRRRQIVRRTRVLVAVVLLLLALGAARTMFVRAANARALESDAAAQAVQYVRTAQPKVAASGQTIALPGTLQGAVQAPISARASGYLKRWTRDIGSRVKQGELLAEIETPEIDQQLAQAVAARQQAASGLSLARSTVARWEALRQKDVVSQQDLDERRGAVAQAVANVAAADANVQRLQQTENFKRVLAPFAGVITRRNVDVGDLIDAGSGGGGRALFMLAQTDSLRVSINVPQAYAQLIRTGQAVVVTQAELRGERFEGKVARTSGSIDPSTRMMQVEVALPNADGRLLPGAFVQVALPLAASRMLTVPTNALLFRAEGTRVAVVDAQSRVRLRTVSLGRNLGEMVEIVDGLSESDRLVLNPSDALADGDPVTVAKEAA